VIFIKHYLLAIMLLLTHERSFVYSENYVKVDVKKEACEGADWT
jgi:hypothetical protein